MCRVSFSFLIAFPKGDRPGSFISHPHPLLQEMSRNPPDVSVIIPTYNRREYLQRATESCFEDENALDIEVIVVDDGSTDDTRAYLESLEDERVHTIFQENQGGSAARNRGMEKARGKYLKFLDDDDYLHPGGLKAQHEALEGSGADVCYGDHILRWEEEERDSQHCTNAEAPDLFTALATSSVDRMPLLFLMRHSSVESVRWDESMEYLEDYAFMLEASSQGLSCEKVDVPVAVHYIHEGPRLSDRMEEERSAFLLRRKCEMFWGAFQRLLNNDPRPPSLLDTGAAAVWEQAHKLAPFDFSEFVEWYRKIKRVHPDFRPERPHPLLKFSDRLFSPLVTEIVLQPYRKLRSTAQRR